MAESKAHMNYVRRIVDYAITSIPQCDKALLIADLPEYESRTPKVIGGYYPDVYHKNSKCIIIGEAKTDNDILNSHSAKQLESYIKEVRCYNIHRHIVICSSVWSFATLKNLIIIKKKEEHLEDITFHVLDVFKRIAVI